MRYSNRILPALALTFFASIGAAETPPALSSFAELFGVDESQAIAIYGAEPARCLSNALEDFNLALSGQDPVHSKSPAFPQLLDGGTTSWKGDCYELTILKRLTTYWLPDGASINGFVVGPSLQLKLVPNASQSSPIARTRFVFIQKKD